MSDKIRVLIWDENPPHAPKELYPGGIREAIAEGLRELDTDGRLEITTAHLDEEDQGASEARLKNTDVIFWWGHARHNEVKNDTTMRVIDRVVNDGAGFVALHSAHYSHPFRRILGCWGHLKGGWRVNDPIEAEEVTVAAPRHPIAQGVQNFVLDAEEMYGAPFDVPPPSCVVFQSHFPLGGEYFPSATWTVGAGKTHGFESGPGKGQGEGEGKARVFYFRPGHETVPTYFDANVRRVLFNAAFWAAHKD